MKSQNQKNINTPENKANEMIVQNRNNYCAFKESEDDNSNSMVYKIDIKSKIEDRGPKKFADPKFIDINSIIERKNVDHTSITNKIDWTTNENTHYKNLESSIIFELDDKNATEVKNNNVSNIQIEKANIDALATNKRISNFSFEEVKVLPIKSNSNNIPTGIIPSTFGAEVEEKALNILNKESDQNEKKQENEKFKLNENVLKNKLIIDNVEKECVEESSEESNLEEGQDHEKNKSEMILEKLSNLI